MDGNGTIDFEEYVRVLATYCMYSKDEIMRFCFDSFDVDNSGMCMYDCVRACLYNFNQHSICTYSVFFRKVFVCAVCW